MTYNLPSSYSFTYLIDGIYTFLLESKVLLPLTTISGKNIISGIFFISFLVIGIWLKLFYLECLYKCLI